MKYQKIAIYHRVMRRENFEKAAQDIFSLLVQAQKEHPDNPRALYVDIDGHRNESGGFDDDMFELQKHFGLEFLLPFFEELHFPLYSVTNPHPQINDFPETFHIGNTQNVKDNRLSDLYIENYSNTEFISENEVYDYLEKVSHFLKEYNTADLHLSLIKCEAYDPDGWLIRWYSNMKDLIIELFNSFLFGNLMSAAAMTRTLIENYIYIRIFMKERSEKLMEDWFISSILCRFKKTSPTQNKEKKKLIQDYCSLKHRDFSEVLKNLGNGYEDSWLKNVIGEKPSIRKLCKYLKDESIYDDYQELCAFVHGQNACIKLAPFLFYSSIYDKFYIMMTYIFKSLRLYPMTEKLYKELETLETGLIELLDTPLFDKL